MVGMTSLDTISHSYIHLFVDLSPVIRTGAYLKESFN